MEDNITNYASFTISSGQTTSSTLSTGLIGNGQWQLHGLEFPAAMTGATMTFTAARSSDGTFVSVRDTGGATAYSITVTASTFVPLEPKIFATLPYLKCVSGSAEGSDRTIVAHYRRIF